MCTKLQGLHLKNYVMCNPVTPNEAKDRSVEININLLD